MIVGKLAGRGRTTIPREARAALRLDAGDRIVFTIMGDWVVLTKAGAGHGDDRFATFNEWASENDCRAYRGL